MSELTVWSGVAYLAGALGIVLGLIFVILNWMVGIPLLLAGLFAIPGVRNKVERYFQIEFTDWVVVGIYCSLFALSITIGIWFTEPLL